MLVPDAAAPAGTRVVVMDFGLARLELESLAEGGEEAAGLTRSGYPIGTLAYMAPEQLEGSTARTSTDVYALGLVLVEMLTGQRVFASLNPPLWHGAAVAGTTATAGSAARGRPCRLDAGASNAACRLHRRTGNRVRQR